MAADNETGYPGDASGQMNPALSGIVDQLQSPEAKSWGVDAANAIQDYLTKKAVVAQSNAAADEFQSNLFDTQSSLANFAKTDASPGGIDLALGLASHVVNGLVSQHQHLDEDTRAGAAGPIINDMQTEIAHAGVQAIAERDRGEAYDAIDRYSDYLPDAHQAELRQYADNQAVLRQQDAAVMQQQQIRDNALGGYVSATQHLGAFTDPDTGSFRAQPGFLANLMADHTIALPTKLALQAGYALLNQHGDVPQSNPHVAADFLTRIGQGNPPQQGEVFSHLGTGLTVNDATFINGLLAPANAQRTSDLRSLSDVVSQARDTLASPANGQAGNLAFGRFTNWLMPALQRGANLTDLMADNRIQQFAPRVSDMVPQPTGPRLPLHMLFAGGAGG